MAEFNLGAVNRQALIELTERQIVQFVFRAKCKIAFGLLLFKCGVSVRDFVRRCRTGKARIVFLHPKPLTALNRIAVFGIEAGNVVINRAFNPNRAARETRRCHASPRDQRIGTASNFSRHALQPDHVNVAQSMADSAPGAADRAALHQKRGAEDRRAVIRNAEISKAGNIQRALFLDDERQDQCDFAGVAFGDDDEARHGAFRHREFFVNHGQPVQRLKAGRRQRRFRPQSALHSFKSCQCFISAVKHLDNKTRAAPPRHARARGQVVHCCCARDAHHRLFGPAASPYVQALVRHLSDAAQLGPR